MSLTPDVPLRVLVVDDSAYNRRAITSSFRSSGEEIEVVATAADGNEALRLVYELKPDVITLDLEMPRMDGFSFLRVLMGTRPTPVIVVSSYSHKENVFRALELGAVDFVAKPDGSELAEGLEPLLQKVLVFRSAQRKRMTVRPTQSPPRGRREMPTLIDAPRITPRNLVAIVASTGGPSALSTLFSQLSPRGSYAVVVAQHMPDKFTRTFAERLNRKSVLDVSEAQHADIVTTQTAFVCPGRHCMEVDSTGGGQIRIRVGAARPEDKYVPSGNRLLVSAAKQFGPRSIGVILTGMGDDGVDGARAICEAGGRVIAESEESAVIYGMPRAALKAGVVTEVLPLPEIAERLDELLR